MPIKTKSCGITDVGLVRSNNEDVFAELHDQHCFIIADGMGGHQAGEVASQEAVRTLIHLLQKNTRTLQASLNSAFSTIQKVISDVNTHIFKMGRSLAELRGMGTTLCLLHVQDKGVVFAHVGDSRIYRFRDGKLELLTKDHSLLSELMDLGRVNENDAGDFHYKNIITRAIGTESSVEPTIQMENVLSEDIFILCSDGLSDLLKREEIEQVLKEVSFLSLAALELIRLSKMKGAHDNITLLLVQVFHE